MYYDIPGPRHSNVLQLRKSWGVDCVQSSLCHYLQHTHVKFIYMCNSHCATVVLVFTIDWLLTHT